MNEKTAGDCIGARQSQVDEQLERLERQIERMDGISSEFISRLSSVLRMEPINKCEQTEPEEILVPLADNLRSIVGKVFRITDELEHALRCVEL